MKLRDALGHFGQSCAKWFTLAGLFVVFCQYSGPWFNEDLTSLFQ